MLSAKFDKFANFDRRSYLDNGGLPVNTLTTKIKIPQIYKFCI